MIVVTPTDCLKLVCNRCVTTVLAAVLCCHVFMWFSVGVGAFVIGLSQISSFFSCILLVYHTFFWLQISLALYRHHTSIFTILCLIRILLKRVQYQPTNDLKIYYTKILYYTSKTRIPNFKLKWIHVRPNFPSVPFILTYLILSTCWLTQLKFGFFSCWWISFLSSSA